MSVGSDVTPLPASTQNAQPDLMTLIAELADPSYAKRSSAKTAILEHGVGALEQLHQASFSEDPEIASAARFLLKSNSFVWESDLDSPRVKGILQKYSGAENFSKQSFVVELAQLERQEGMTALCRIARYEPLPSVAKLAALKILTAPLSVGQTKEAFGARVLPLIGGGSNTSSIWLRNYFATDSLNAPWWGEQVVQELNSLSALPRHSPSFLEIEFAIDFAKWGAEKIATEGKDRDLAISLGPQMLAALDASRRFRLGRWSSRLKDLEDSLPTWALDCGLYELIAVQYESFDESKLKSTPIFAYYLAESLQQQGESDKADKIAELALDRKFLRLDGTPFPPPSVSSSSSESDFFEYSHQEGLGQLDKLTAIAVGNSLRKRGRFEWALREFQRATDGPVTSAVELRALYDVATIHHSLENFAAAKGALEPLIQKLKLQPMLSSQLQLDTSMVDMVTSAYHQYSGDVERSQGNNEEAESCYVQAFKVAPDNVDALIALYGLPLNAERREIERKRRIQKINELAIYVGKLEEFLKNRTLSQFEGDRTELAIQLNSLAWLIANTEGDFALAIAHSRRACRLAPKSPEFLDTLSHAYFAYGDVAQAVEQQRQAVKMMPHVPEFQRALAKFEAKLAKSNSN